MTSKIIYHAAGSPDQQGETVGVCTTCGEDGIGIPFKKWVKKTFTDFDLLRPGSIVCHACLFCFDEQSTLIQKMAARDKPQRFRTYSHFVTDGTWHIFTKAQKGDIRHLLLSASPKVAVIADSGQKHLVLRSRPGMWQFELESLVPEPDRLAEILGISDDLYTRGATKADMLSGSYSMGSISRVGINEWRRLEDRLKPNRGSILFDLAIFLTEKQEHEPDEPGIKSGQQFSLFT